MLEAPPGEATQTANTGVSMVEGSGTKFVEQEQSSYTP